jgi:hypothetical protein
MSKPTTTSVSSYMYVCVYVFFFVLVLVHSNKVHAIRMDDMFLSSCAHLG